MAIRKPTNSGCGYFEVPCHVLCANVNSVREHDKTLHLVEDIDAAHLLDAQCARFEQGDFRGHGHAFQVGRRMDGPVPGLQGWRSLTVAHYSMTGATGFPSSAPAIPDFTNATTPQIPVASTPRVQRTDNRTVTCIEGRPGHDRSRRRAGGVIGPARAGPETHRPPPDGRGPGSPAAVPPSALTLRSLLAGQLERAQLLARVPGRQHRDARQQHRGERQPDVGGDHPVLADLLGEGQGPLLDGERARARHQ